jgi:hypothetical protein
MIIGMISMAVLPRRNAPGGRVVVGGLPFPTRAVLAYTPAISASVRAREPRTSAGTTDPSAIPTGA